MDHIAFLKLKLNNQASDTYLLRFVVIFLFHFFGGFRKDIALVLPTLPSPPSPPLPSDTTAADAANGTGRPPALLAQHRRHVGRIFEDSLRVLQNSADMVPPRSTSGPTDQRACRQSPPRRSASLRTTRATLPTDRDDVVAPSWPASQPPTRYQFRRANSGGTLQGFGLPTRWECIVLKRDEETREGGGGIERASDEAQAVSVAESERQVYRQQHGQKNSASSSTLKAEAIILVATHHNRPGGGRRGCSSSS